MSKFLSYSMMIINQKPCAKISCDLTIIKIIYALKTSLNRSRRWAWADRRVRLHPDRVDGVRGEVGNGGELVVVDELRLPAGHGQMWIGCVVNFVTLKLK